MKNIKSKKTYEEQIEILRTRGCVIDDEGECKRQLSRINYYRLSAYFIPYKNDADTYTVQISFQKIVDTYEFDRKLRNILMLALEEVETNLRSKLAYYHAHKYGALGYMDPKTHTSERNKQKAPYNHADFLKTFWSQVSASKTNLIAQHHMEKYGGNFPLWVAVEFFPFGMLSRFFSNMIPSDRRAFARENYFCHAESMESWLRCCTDLRNVCAHYGRLYYRIFPAIPRGVGVNHSSDPYANRRLFPILLALKNLHLDSERWNQEVLEPIDALIDRYGDSITLWHIGFPTDWRNVLSSQ